MPLKQTGVRPSWADTSPDSTSQHMGGYKSWADNGQGTYEKTMGSQAGTGLGYRAERIEQQRPITTVANSSDTQAEATIEINETVENVDLFNTNENSAATFDIGVEEKAIGELRVPVNKYGVNVIKKKMINFNIDIAIYPSYKSKKKIDLTTLSQSVAKDLKRIFKGSYETKAKTPTLLYFEPGKINVTGITEMASLKSNQHLVVLIDNIYGDAIGVAVRPSRICWVEVDYATSTVITHELCHTFGLDHPFSKEKEEYTKKNVMWDHYIANGLQVLSGKQLYRIYSSILNKEIVGDRTKVLKYPTPDRPNTSDERPYGKRNAGDIVPLEYEEANLGVRYDRKEGTIIIKK